MKILTPFNVCAAYSVVMTAAVLVLIFLRKANPKLDSTVLFTKGFCHVVIGFFTPLTSGLAQWANSGELPGIITWIVTGAFCIVGAASSMLSFLSGSYSDFLKGRANGTAAPGDNTTTLASKLAGQKAVYDSLPKTETKAPEPPKAP